MFQHHTWRISANYCLAGRGNPPNFFPALHYFRNAFFAQSIQATEDCATGARRGSEAAPKGRGQFKTRSLWDERCLFVNL